MGHYCKICRCQKSNESFSGKGHKNHVCKECTCIPKEERESIGNEEEIYRFLTQSRISAKNISRLKVLTKSKNNTIVEYATIVLEVGKVTPYKKRRLKILAQKRSDLLGKLDETGLILAHHH